MKAMRLKNSAALVLVGLLLVAGCTTTTTSGRAKLGEPSASDRRGQLLADHIQLGMGYLGEGNRESARHHLLKALEVDSRSAGAHGGMALLFQLEQEYELADSHFRKAISYDPDFTSARNNYGVFLYRQGRYEEAYQQLEKATSDTAYSRRAQVYSSLGTTAARLNRVEQARDAWLKAISLNPRLARPHIELASHYFTDGDYPRAKAYLDKYHQLHKASARSLWLGVKLEREFGNKDGEASQGLALRKLFPYSEEALEYKRWLAGER